MRDLALELLEFIDDVVDDLGSRWAVEYVHTVLREGTSADRQLAVYRADRRSQGRRARHRRADTESRTTSGGMQRMKREHDGASGPMKVGLLCGREYSFPPAFIARVNEVGRAARDHRGDGASSGARRWTRRRSTG